MRVVGRREGCEPADRKVPGSAFDDPDAKLCSHSAAGGLDGDRAIVSACRSQMAAHAASSPVHCTASIRLGFLRNIAFAMPLALRRRLVRADMLQHFA